MNMAHLHLMLTHVPVIGTAFALVLLVVALARRSDELKKAALWAFAVAALIAIPVYLTGEPAEESVEQLAGVTDDAIEQHEESAQAAFALILILGGIAGAGLAFLRAKAVPQWFAISLLALSVATSGMLGWTANTGGQIRHTEIRAGG
jgi:uncharacterized membrane protein